MNGRYPVTLNLNEAEFQALEEARGAEPRSSYIKRKVFTDLPPEVSKVLVNQAPDTQEKAGARAAWKTPAEFPHACVPAYDPVRGEMRCGICGAEVE